jgi:tetratricopeptide (TPR) repeat protein
VGQHDKALIEVKRARELEPLNLRINALEGQALFFAGRYDEAIDRLQKTLELDSNFLLAHLFLSRVYIEKKMYAEAVTEAAKARDVSGGNSEATAHVIYALAKAGKQKEARATLDELKKRASERYVPPYAFALSYNGLGETDQAIAWLEKGLHERDLKMNLLVVDPKWNNLRSDHRFQDVLRRAGFITSK